MPIDLPVILLVAVVALVVASTVARRAGEHADRVAGRRPVVHAARGGPVGAVIDLVDQSVAAYSLRRRLGLSTRTRSQRRAEEARAALVAKADEIRRQRTGAAPHARPTHLVVAGRLSETQGATHLPPARQPSTLPYELMAAGVGFLLVVGIVVAIAPRGTGDVLSATGNPPASAPVVPSPTSSQTSPVEPAPS